MNANTILSSLSFLPPFPPSFQLPVLQISPKFFYMLGEPSATGFELTLWLRQALTFSFPASETFWEAIL